MDLHQNLFQDLGENTCLLHTVQPALKSTAPSL